MFLVSTRLLLCKYLAETQGVVNAKIILVSFLHVVDTATCEVRCDVMRIYGIPCVSV